MRTLLNILFIAFLFGQSSAQTFKQYKKTSFYFVSADKKISGQGKVNSYIKKGDTILILNKTNVSDFLTLFEQAPQSFDSLFKILPWQNPKTWPNKKDKVLKVTTYKISSDIDLTSISEKDNFTIWNLTNSDYVLPNLPCYLTITFKNIGNNKTFDKVNLGHCDY